jgi:RNA repair pathway DNA polymerase beta family
MKPNFAQYGFVHQENLIMACIGGSQAHGARLGATDDTDWYGLYIPPPINVLGLEREDILFLQPEANREATGRSMWTFAFTPS